MNPTGNAPTTNEIEKSKTTALAPIALEVLPYITEIHENLRETYARLKTDLISLSNEVILAQIEGIPCEGKRIDCQLALGDVKGKLVSKEKEKGNQRGANIVDNYLTKVSLTLMPKKEQTPQPQAPQEAVVEQKVD